MFTGTISKSEMTDQFSFPERAADTSTAARIFLTAARTKASRMSHRSRRQFRDDETDIAGPVFWIGGTLVAIVAIIAIGLLATGCRHSLVQASPQSASAITTPVAAVRTSAAKTVTAVEAVVPVTTTAGRPVAEQAVRLARETVQAADRAVASSEEFASTLAKLDSQNAMKIESAQKKARDAGKERDDAVTKYDEAWFGGQTHRWMWRIGAMIGIGIALQIFAPALGLLGPIGSIVGKLVSLLGHALTGFVSVAFGLVDAIIAKIDTWAKRRAAK